MTIAPFLILLGSVNLFSLILMGIDKHKAIKDKYRISEKTLFLSAIPFSSYGFALGMKLFRHKTKKLYFKLGSYFLMIIHTALLLFILNSFVSFDGILSQFNL